MKLIPDTLEFRIEVLKDVFLELAMMGDVSMQMDSDRGGVFIQVSNREWPDGIQEAVERATIHVQYLEIDHGRYSTVIKFKGDEIKN